MGKRDQDKVRAERARDVGLFRYALIREAASLAGRERGAMVRELAAVEHRGPDGRMVKVSRATLDRWIADWKKGGFDALVPAPRLVQRRTPGQVLDLAVALKREVPARTAAQIAAILTESGQVVPSCRTLQRHFAALGLKHEQTPAAAFGRFEADEPGEIWVGDAMHGPMIDGRKALLFAFMDDHTRLLTGYRWVRREDTIRMEIALRAGIASRGIPQIIYVDNGSPYVDGQFLSTLARLGVRVVHSAPGRPQGRGKIERFFRTVRDQFLVEIGAGRELESMEQLGEYFSAWVETVYHRTAHSETGQGPLERWNTAWEQRREAGGPGPNLPGPGLLREAFLFTETRTVTKTALVSLHSNTYEVDAALAGRKVELVFDPHDLTDITVRYDGRNMGKAAPHQVRRHVHPKARPDETTQAPEATGIDYLALLAARRDRDLVEKISYATSPHEDGGGADPLADDSTGNGDSAGGGITAGSIDIVDGLIQPNLWANDTTTADPTTTATRKESAA